VFNVTLNLDICLLPYGRAAALSHF
jgi:hypothetical protein